MQPQLQVYDPYTEELKRRQMAAKAAGWSDEEIAQFSDADMRNHLVQQQTQAPQPQEQPKRRGGWGSAIMSLLPGGSLVDKAIHHEKITGGDIATEAALTALPFGLGKVGKAIKGFRAARAATGAAKGGAGQVAERMFTQAFDVHPQLLKRGVNPLDTANELLTKYPGLVKGSLPNMKAVAGQVTGESGQMSKLVRQAYGNVKGDIRVDEFMPQVKYALDEIADLTPAEEARIMSTIRRTERPGSLPLTMNPLDAFDQIKKLEKIGYEHIYKGAQYGGSLKSEQIGKAYLVARDALDESLQAAVGNQGVIQALKSPETLMQLSKIHPNLAQEFMQAQTIGDLRRIQKPFVNLSQMIDSTERQANMAGSRLLAGGVGTRAAGAGAGFLIGGLPGAAIGFFGAPLVRGAEEAVRAPVATTTGRVLKKIVGGGPGQPKPAKTPAQLFKRQLGLQAAVRSPRLLASGEPAPDQQGAFDPFSQMASATAPSATDFGVGAMDSQTIDVGGQQYPLSTFTPEVIDQMIRDDIAKTGGENLGIISKIVDIQQSLTPKTPKATSPYGRPTSQQYALANAGAQSVQKLAQMISSNPSLVERGTVPGQGLPVVGGFVQRGLGTGEYKATIANAVDAILRLRTGAQANKQEIDQYVQEFMPRAGNDPSTIQAKLQQLMAAFEPFLGAPQGATFDPFSDMSQAGFDPFSQMQGAY